MQPTGPDKLLIQYHEQDSLCGVTHDTVMELARRLDMSEVEVHHHALAKLANELPRTAYEPDDGEFPGEQIGAIQAGANQGLPKGLVIGRKRLFE